MLLLVVLAGALAAPSTASALVIGIADQKTDMFGDPRFAALDIGHARYTVPWDVLDDPYQAAAMDRWMTAAFQQGVQPLLSFGPSHRDRKDIPTPRELRLAFRAVRATDPWATTWATWNEANHCGAQLCNRAPLVAAYFRNMRAECRSCKVLAAELLDMPNMLEWVREFRRYSKVEPRWWGLHNYVEANRFKTTSLRKLLRQVRGEIWLTEVGGIVKRRVKKRFTVKRIPESQWHALRVTRFIFRDVVRLSPRIKRVYVYHWNASTSRDSWDSALIDWTGRLRPAFAVVAAEVRRRSR